MYNVYSHDKKLKKEQKEKKITKALKSSENQRGTLTAKYKDRINSTLLELNKQAENMPKPRAKTANRMNTISLHPSQTDQQRIKQCESWNSWLDHTPSEKLAFHLRAREKSREIQPSLKLRAKSGIDRLREKLSTQRQYLESSDPPNSGQKGQCKDFNGEVKQVPMGGKEFMNYYHFKTHFKTIQGIALDLHASTRNLSKAELKKKHNDEKLGMTEIDKNKDFVQDALCKEDLVPISIEILEKFGFWKEKKEHRRNNSSKLSTPKWVYSRINKENVRKNSIS